MTEADEFGPGGMYDDASNPLHDEAHGWPVCDEEGCDEMLTSDEEQERGWCENHEEEVDDGLT